jgi:DNA-directed RNA polymerase specialized sigma24 family protein
MWLKLLYSSPMKTHLAITQEKFDELLAWLDSDRENAGYKYEEIRRSLVKIFAWRKCVDAEGMADATINIVAQKVRQLRSTYEGKPHLYFYGVARNLIREYENSRRVLVPLEDANTTNTPIVDDTDDDREQVDMCLSKCLGKLASQDRTLALAYYQKDGRAKIDLRRKLAEDLGIDSNVLRVKMHRMRGSLAQCIEGCLKSISAK